MYMYQDMANEDVDRKFKGIHIHVDVTKISSVVCLTWFGSFHIKTKPY